MAKFRQLLSTGNTTEPISLEFSQQQLLVATLLWLRTYSRDSPQWLGLQSLVNLLVPYHRDMKLGVGIPPLPAGKIITSAGDIYEIQANVPGQFVYTSRNFTRELDLDMYGSLELTYSVHYSYVEWAIATAIVMLAKAGKPWHRDQVRAPVTIGGMEVIDFF